MGATRRLDYVDAASGWHYLFVVAAVGACIIALGLIFQVLQVLMSIKDRKLNRAGNDPWNGRTLEWSTHSPPPVYNFAVIPTVTNRDAWWQIKEDAKTDVAKEVEYEDIEMPCNTAVGVYIALCAFMFGFGMIWHMWWLALLGVFAAILLVISRSFDENIEYVIPASEVARIEKSFT